MPQVGDTPATPLVAVFAGPPPPAAGAPATTALALDDAGADEEPPLQLPRDLASEQAWPVAVRLTATHVYWANWGSYQLGAIARMAKQGGQVEFLTMSKNLPDSLYIDDQFAYWSERMGGAVQRIPLVGGQSEVLRGSTSLFTWVLGNDALYFSESGNQIIQSMPKSGGHANTVVVPNDPEANTATLLVRVHENEVFWTQQATNNLSGEVVTRLYRAGRAAAQQELVTEELAVMLGDVAFDRDNVYWTVSEPYRRCQDTTMCPVGGPVRAKPLAGGEARTIVSAEDYPSALTVDAERIYWGTHKGIRSARKDGSDLKTVVAVSGGPISIAVDDEAVYWATYAERGTIARAPK